MSDAFDFSPAGIALRLRERLDPALRFDKAAGFDGDHVLNALPLERSKAAGARPAAVLVPILAREPEVTLLLTQRATGLRQHSGQISFPGGKLDPGETPLAGAVREAQEEIGLDPHAVSPVGELDPYITGTGFRILPVVALVTPQPHLTLNEGEVEEAFEVPLTFLFDQRNHHIHSREWQGVSRNFYAMPYGERYIWGATAAIIRRLYERLR